MSQKKLVIFLSILKGISEKIEAHFPKKAELIFDSNFSKERRDILESYKKHYEEYEQYDHEKLLIEKSILQNHVLSEELKKSNLNISTPFIIALASITFSMLISVAIYLPNHISPFIVSALEYRISISEDNLPDFSEFQDIIISLTNQIMDLALNSIRCIMIIFFILFLILYICSLYRAKKNNANILVLERRIVVINKLLSENGN